MQDGFWRHSVLVLAAFLVAFGLDQVSKWFILNVIMQPARQIELTGFFRLTLGFNEGASFGMLGQLMAGSPIAMAGLTGLLTAFILVCALRSTGRLEGVALGLIAGGASGNILDRLRQGAVTDFLDAHWQEWHWPTFNMADVTITVGAALLIFVWPVPRRKPEPMDG